MSIELSNLSIEQLEQLKLDIDREISDRKKHKQKSLRADIERLAREAGVSLEELFGGAAKQAKAKSTVAAKYRNPADPSQTWSGRGRQPVWLAALLAEGKSLADFLI